MQRASLGIGAHYYITGENAILRSTQYSFYDTLMLVTYDSVYFDSINFVYDTVTLTSLKNVTLTESLQNNYQGQNVYNSIGIPLTFGYQFNLNKWSIIPRVGFVLEMGIRNSSGTYLNNELTEFMRYDALKMGISYSIQCEIRREFDKWHVFLSPFYRGSLKPAIVGDNWNIRYHNYGVNMGVGFAF